MVTLKKTFSAIQKRPMLAADAFMVLAVLGTIGFVIIDRFNDASAETNICRAPAKAHEVTVRNDRFSQKSLTVNLCDTIHITTLDDQPYHFNFGTHDEHISYPGFTPLIQSQNESIVIDALETGEFHLHDHIRDTAALDLTIRPKK